MSCIPFLYGVGASVALIRGYWPPPQIPPVACPPPNPQRPSPPPPQQPQPPPTQAYVEVRYYLSFPTFVGVNVKIFNVPANKYIFPSSKPIAMNWRYFPALDARPKVVSTISNPLIYTYLRPFADHTGGIHVDIDPGLPYPSSTLIVIQFLYQNQRWVIVCHEVYFPPVPSNATANDYRIALRNRTEKLIAFYDSALEGFGSFRCSDLTIHLTLDTAIIPYFIYPQPEYYIEPTGSPAYCMFIAPWRWSG